MSDLHQSLPDDEPFDLEREPLDRQPGFGVDWGGDGSNLHRPVREHVLVALRPASGPYEPPLDALLGLGNIEAEELERRAEELGIGQHHVPELVRMTRDRAFSTANGTNPVVFAPDHAMHLLKGLDVSDHLAELLSIFDLDFDEPPEQLTDVLAITGDAALAPTAAYVHDRTRWLFGRSLAASAVRKIAEQNPNLRESAIASLGEVLANAESDDEVAVTGALTALIDLEATETLPLIRHAFEIGKIDEMANGSWG